MQRPPTRAAHPCGVEGPDDGDGDDDADIAEKRVQGGQRCVIGPLEIIEADELRLAHPLTALGPCSSRVINVCSPSVDGPPCLPERCQRNELLAGDGGGMADTDPGPHGDRPSLLEQPALPQPAASLEEQDGAGHRHAPARCGRRAHRAPRPALAAGDAESLDGAVPKLHQLDAGMHAELREDATQVVVDRMG